MRASSNPLAYFVTFTTYGTWLHGRDSGSVDPEHNLPGTLFLPPDSNRESAGRRAMTEEEYLLDTPRRVIVLRTILEVSNHRRWQPWAVHVRSNHVHAVLSATCKPEKVLVDLKSYSSRRLRESLSEPDNRKRWTEHGSTRYLWTEEAVAATVHYVLEEQGEKMAWFDGRLQDLVAVELPVDG